MAHMTTAQLRTLNSLVARVTTAKAAPGETASDAADRVLADLLAPDLTPLLAALERELYYSVAAHG